MTNRDVAKEVLRPEACLHCINLGALIFARAWSGMMAAIDDESAVEIFHDIQAKLAAGLLHQDREAVARVVLLLAEWEDSCGPFLDIIPKDALEQFIERLKAEIARSEK